MSFPTRFGSHHDASRDLKRQCASALTAEAYLPTVLGHEAVGRRVIYLHVPFCNKVCSFCPFHRPDALDRRTYHMYLLRAIDAVRDYPYMRGRIDAVNFGGGTPTALSPSQMAAVLDALHENFDLASDAEISVETSATELTDEMLSVLVAGGVNRLSIGIQTFDDGARRLLGRRGSGAFAASRVAAALDAGIRNTNVDLIYNYPDETEAQLLSDIGMIASLDVAGVSLYPLMLHERTPLFRRLDQGAKARMADLSRERLFFDRIYDGLGAQGYRMLELTKLVKDGRDRYAYMEIRHSGGDCIALGHGAGGNIGDYYYHNSCEAPDVSADLRICSRGRVLRPVYRAIDAFIYAMQKGSADLAYHSAAIGIDLSACFSPLLHRFSEEGYLTRTGDRIALTRDGVFYGNNIISELVRVIAQSGV